MKKRTVKKALSLTAAGMMLAAGFAVPDAAETFTGITDTSISVSAASTPVVYYSAHVQSYGWLPTVYGGATAGTTGQSKRLEAFKINSHVLKYRSHVQGTGWQGWKTNNEISGTTGQSKAVEAIQIDYLNDSFRNGYDVLYRVHMKDLGWSKWCKNGEVAGTTGQSRRIEAIEIRFQKQFSYAGAYRVKYAFSCEGVTFYPGETVILDNNGYCKKNKKTINLIPYMNYLDPLYVNTK